MRRVLLILASAASLACSRPDPDTPLIPSVRQIDAVNGLTDHTGTHTGIVFGSFRIRLRAEGNSAVSVNFDDPLGRGANVIVVVEDSVNGPELLVRGNWSRHYAADGDPVRIIIRRGDERIICSAQPTVQGVRVNAMCHWQEKQDSKHRLS